MTKKYTIKNIEISEEEIRNLIKKNPELLVDEKSYSPWRAEKKENYFYIDSCGDLYPCLEATDRIDDYRYLTGNYFKTKEEAEAKKIET